MKNKWVFRLGVPIFALMLAVGCTPDRDAPGDDNKPGTESPDAPDDNVPGNNDIDQNAPENERNEPHEGRPNESNTDWNYDKYEGYQ